jgi:hypothetical protein
MKNLAPHIIRQRLLIEGFYTIHVDEKVIEKYFYELIKHLSLRTYGKPIIHCADNIGKEVNSGYDAFIPLIDSGIYLGAWTKERFLSIVIYTCKSFDNKKAVNFTKKFWDIAKIESKSF